MAGLLPHSAQWSSAIRVIDSEPPEYRLFLNIDALKQQALCYVERANI